MQDVLANGERGGRLNRSAVRSSGVLYSTAREVSPVDRLAFIVWFVQIILGNAWCWELIVANTKRGSA